MINKLYTLKSETFIFFISLIFYLLLWFLDPGHKVIVTAFFGLIFLFNWRLKDVRLSVLVTYLTSVIIFTGKTYLIQLIPPGIFSQDLFPLGYVRYFIISPKHLLSLCLLLILVRDLVKIKTRPSRFIWADFFLITYFMWTIFTDVFVSLKPTISLLFSLSGLEGLILYFYLRVYLVRWSKFINILFGLLAAMILFESFISFQQFIASSPIFKSIEAQVNIEHFGQATDELLFRFRPVGTFDHANGLAAFLILPLSLYFMRLYKNSSFANLVIFTLGITTLIMTLSRSAWLGLFIGIMCMLYVLEKSKKIRSNIIFQKHKLSLVIFEIMLFAFFIFPRAEKSFFSFGQDEGGGYLRKRQIETTFNLIVQHPIFGVGTLMSVERALEIDPESIFITYPEVVHNWYLLVVVEHGILALCLFSLFVLFSFNKVVVRLKNTKTWKTMQFYSLAFLTGILSLLIVGIFQPGIWELLIILSSALLTTNFVKNEHFNKKS